MREAAVRDIAIVREETPDLAEWFVSNGLAATALRPDRYTLGVRCSGEFEALAYSRASAFSASRSSSSAARAKARIFAQRLLWRVSAVRVRFVTPAAPGHCRQCRASSLLVT